MQKHMCLSCRPSSPLTQRTIEEYLYRFVALAAGGWAAGPWQRGRSRSKGKRCLVSWQALGVLF